MAWWLFQNAVVTLVLAAAVLLVCRFVRIGPVARHALWVLVLVKFVTPPLVVWPWPAPDPFGLAVAAEASLPATDPMAEAALSEPSSSGPAVVVDVARPGNAGNGFQESIPLVVWTWALGSLGLLALESVRLARLARRVRRGRAADAAIVNRVNELSQQLGLKPVPVVAIDGAASPMVWCFGRTRLLWPASLTNDVTDACIDGLIVHELAHVKRKDHLVGWIELAAGVVWWWNPLFWFVRAALREQAELACDAWVISALPNGRRAYAESLLALSGAALRGTPSMSMAVMGIRASSRRVLERRLVMIMKGRAPLRLPVAGVLTIALMAVATLPAWATGGQQSTPPPPPPTPVVAQTAPPSPPAAPVPARRAERIVGVPQTAPPPPPPAPAQVRTRDGRVVAVPVVETMPARARQSTRADQARPVASPPKVVAAVPAKELTYRLTVKTALPADGQALLTSYEADVEAIYKEIDPKIEARRQAAIKALEALQEQYTKQGKLDEAVAIRDFLRAGGPTAKTGVYSFVTRKGGK